MVILRSISNREKAYVALILFGIVLITILRPKDMSEIARSFAKALKPAFSRSLGLITAAFLMGSLACVFILRYFDLWDLSLLKQTVFWFATVVLVRFFKLSEVKSTSAFKTLVRRTFALTVLVPFFLHFFNFSFTFELVFVFVQTFFVIILVFLRHEKDASYQSAEWLSSSVLKLLAITYIINAVIGIATRSSKLFTTHTLHELLLSMMLSSLFLPLVYLNALLLHYMSGFHWVRSTVQKADRRSYNLMILKSCGLSLDRIGRVAGGLNFSNPPTFEEVRALATR